MKQMPKDQLNPKVKNVWRLNDGLWIVLGAAVVLVSEIIIKAGFSGEGFEPGVSVMDLLILITLIVAAVMLVVWLVVLPPIRFARWHYEMNEEYLDIAKGIIWRKRYIIPFIRVQNTDTRQGPFLRVFGLASVTVATAAGNHEIPGLAVEVADSLRDKAAEFARLAREDV